MLNKDIGKYDISEWIFTLQQQNLVYNHNFKYFSNKNWLGWNHPDGWVYRDQGSGGQITSDGTKCIITKSKDSSMMTFSQALHEFPRWETVFPAKTITARACLEIYTPGSAVTIRLSDGVTDSIQTIRKMAESIAELRLNVSAQAKKLSIGIESQSPGALIRISAVYANIGNIAIESLPCIINGVIGERKQYIATENPPAEELSLCQGAIELSENQTRLDSVLYGRFGKGANGRSLLPDVRGLFSRAWNNGAPTDTDASTRKMIGNSERSGDLVGTGEGDIFREHKHDLDLSQLSIPIGDKGTATVIIPRGSLVTKNTGEGETRPKNCAELYTIKWA